MVGPSKSRPPMSHRKTDLGIPCRSKSAKVVLASVFITYALLLGPRAPVRETRRSSSASDLTKCSRSRMAYPEMDWVGKSRRGPGRPFDSTG